MFRSNSRFHKILIGNRWTLFWRVLVRYSSQDSWWIVRLVIIITAELILSLPWGHFKILVIIVTHRDHVVGLFLWVLPTTTTLIKTWGVGLLRGAFPSRIAITRRRYHIACLLRSAHEIRYLVPRAWLHKVILASRVVPAQSCMRPIVCSMAEREVGHDHCTHAVNRNEANLIVLI